MLDTIILFKTIVCAHMPDDPHYQETDRTPYRQACRISSGPTGIGELVDGARLLTRWPNVFPGNANFSGYGVAAHRLEHALRDAGDAVGVARRDQPVDEHAQRQIGEKRKFNHASRLCLDAHRADVADLDRLPDVHGLGEHPSAPLQVDLAI